MRGEARPDVADELQGRGCVRVRGPVDTILQDQVLLGERLGLFTIPGRAERVRLTRPARTREHQTLNLIIPINFPVVVIITLLPLERHRLVLVLVLLLDGSLVVIRRRQRGHPPRIHQPLLAVHAC